MPIISFFGSSVVGRTLIAFSFFSGVHQVVKRQQGLTGLGPLLMERRQESLWDVITDVALEVGAAKRVVVADGATLTSVLRKPKSLRCVDITFASFTGAIIVN